MIYTILDIETTGLNKDKDDILEVGYIRVNSECHMLGYGTLFFYKPEFNVESKAQEIHGLTRTFLQEYENDFLKNCAALYTLMQDGIIVGKNSDAFDIPFIMAFLRKYANELIQIDIANTIDIQVLYEPRYQEWYHKTYHTATKKKGKLEDLIHMQGYNIQTLQEDYGKQFSSQRNQVHSALFDTYMTFILLRDFVKKGKCI